MNRGLTGALIATLLAVAYFSTQDEEAPAEGTVAARKPRTALATAAQPETGSGEGIGALPVRSAATIEHDLFAQHSFLPPPSAVNPATAAPPPPAPTAPPLPFRYQGRMTEGKETTVFLAQGERVLVARQGDLLNNQYRVESVTANAVTFMFVPLKQRQTLSIGNAK